MNDTSSFRIIGLINPLGAYPSDLVYLVGKVEKSNIMFSSTDTYTLVSYRTDDDKANVIKELTRKEYMQFLASGDIYLYSFARLRILNEIQRKVNYNYKEDLVFAIDKDHLVFYKKENQEKLFIELLKDKAFCNDPFKRAIYSRYTGNLDLTLSQYKACIDYIKDQDLPGFLNEWIDQQVKNILPGEPFEEIISNYILQYKE